MNQPTYTDWQDVTARIKAHRGTREDWDFLTSMEKLFPGLHRKYQLRAAKSAQRARKAAECGPIRHITIPLTPAEWSEVKRLVDCTNEQDDLYKRAFLTGLRFRANIGAGKVKPGRTMPAVE